MRKVTLLILALVFITIQSNGQHNPFDKINFLLGNWSGSGKGFGNEKSMIESSFRFVMSGQYIKVRNESRFEPTEKKPEGELHIDEGFISYDQSRKAIIYRQFNIEGYFNQYLLNDSLSNDSLLVFETELIENFVPGGSARWTVKKLSGDELETTFDVSFPGKGYSCFGVNNLNKKQ